MASILSTYGKKDSQSEKHHAPDQPIKPRTSVTPTMIQLLINHPLQVTCRAFPGGTLYLSAPKEENLSLPKLDNARQK